MLYVPLYTGKITTRNNTIWGRQNSYFVLQSLVSPSFLGCEMCFHVYNLDIFCIRGFFLIRVSSCRGKGRCTFRSNSEQKECSWSSSASSAWHHGAARSSLLHLDVRKNSFLEGGIKPLAQVAQGSGGITDSGSDQKAYRCGTGRHCIVLALAVLE